MRLAGFVVMGHIEAQTGRKENHGNLTFAWNFPYEAPRQVGIGRPRGEWACDAMQRTDDAGRAAPLVLELASGTARLRGEELELPLREFKLLAALAARVGEVVPSVALIKAVWPDAPWTSSNDLYTLVSKLRRLIDGPDKFGNNIRNRRGFGYVLDLEPDQLVVIDPARVEPTPLTIDLNEKGSEPPPEPAVAAPAETDSEQPSPTAVARRNPLRTAPPWALLVALLLAASWGAAYVVSSRSSDGPEARTSLEQVPDVGQAEVPKKTEPTEPRRPQRKEEGKKQSRNGQTGKSGPAVVVAAPGSADTPSTTTAPAAPPGSTKGSRKGSENKEPAPPQLPPAPTRYLYHLVNQQTGDHFVTTEASTASEYQAMGYDGGAIARVYSYQEKHTKAISTNQGTAYIFISGSPKTEPDSRAVPLWYSSNGKGDFFYTTNESEAKASGWQGSVIGYARSL